MPAPQLKLTTNHKIACGRSLRGSNLERLTPLQVPLRQTLPNPARRLTAGRKLARKFLPAVCLRIAGRSARRAASFALVPCETIPF